MIKKHVTNSGASLGQKIVVGLWITNFSARVRTFAPAIPKKNDPPPLSSGKIGGNDSGYSRMVSMKYIEIRLWIMILYDFMFILGFASQFCSIGGWIVSEIIKWFKWLGFSFDLFFCHHERTTTIYRLTSNWKLQSFINRWVSQGNWNWKPPKQQTSPLRRCSNSRLNTLLWNHEGHFWTLLFGKFP